MAKKVSDTIRPSFSLLGLFNRKIKSKLLNRELSIRRLAFFYLSSTHYEDK